MVSAKRINGKNAAKILRYASRDLDNSSTPRQLDEDQLSHLTNYNMKFVKCAADEQTINPDSGNREYGAVVVRLCPSEHGCDDDLTKGCKSEYGDIVVSASTFAQAWFYDQGMGGDDNFAIDDYGACAQYQPDGDDDQYADYNFYVGPTCTEDGDDLRLALFEDENCKYESGHMFEALSGGWSLPYSEGGLVSTSCISCEPQNDGDDDGYQVREMCDEIYENAPYKCESNMEFTSYYGADESGCEYIQELMPQENKAGWIVLWVLLGLTAFLLLVCCCAKVMNGDDDDSTTSSSSRREPLNKNSNKSTRRRSTRKRGFFARLFRRRR